MLEMPSASAIPSAAQAGFRRSHFHVRSQGLVGEEVVHGREQERAELALFRPDGIKKSALEQLGEELLREVLGFVRIISASPQIAVEGIPVRRT